MKWVPYIETLWGNQSLPPAERWVLVQIAGRRNDLGALPPAVAVGYMRFAAGDKNSPVFTIPGVGGVVVAWCDCLGDDFHAPLWTSTSPPEAPGHGE